MKNLIRSFSFVIAAAALSAPSAFSAPTPKTTKVQWLGHAAFAVTTPEGHVLIIDPWLTNPMNPDAKDGKDPVAAISKADYILITHGHFDHVGEAVALGKKTGAKLVSNFELANNLVADSGYPKEQAQMDTMINPGGQIQIAGGEVTVSMTPAIHSSGMNKAGTAEAVYGGTPGGYVVQIKNGPTIYHTGDTAYFSDMKLIGDDYHPDLALINIGGHFGMEPPAAAKAAKAVHPKLVVPMHYKTFPVLTQDAGGFFKLLDAEHIAHKEMKPGEILVFDGTKLQK
jgi:L-ascorbate metabolism protein UlaG (beta-lactamase superfamily)